MFAESNDPYFHFFHLIWNQGLMYMGFFYLFSAILTATLRHNIANEYYKVDSPAKNWWHKFEKVYLLKRRNVI